MDKRILAGIVVLVLIVAGVGAYYLMMPQPKKVEITLLYNEGNTYRQQIASIIASEWGKLGISVTVRSEPWPTLLQHIEGKDWDAYLIGWAPDFVDPDDYVYPLMYGGTVFSALDYEITTNQSMVSTMLKTAKVIQVEDNWYVVVGEKGTGATVSLPSTAKLVIVAYTVDTENTKAREDSTPWIDINPSYYRNVTADALILVGEQISDFAARKAVYQAVQIIANQDLPALFLVQMIYAHSQWTWVDGYYYHPVLAPRYDLLWEESDTPSVEIGSFGNGKRGTPTLTYYNNKTTMSFITFGFPETFDPAANYESFGWEIFHQIGDTLLTYWKTETEDVAKDAAIAWVHDPSSTTWYFVIRDGLKAYNPWKDVLAQNGTQTDEVYNITALDVLFTIWRIARLKLDPSWMIRSYVDVNASAVLTESEFDQVLQSGNLIAEWNGQTETPTSLNDLLNFFGESGTGTAGVVRLNLTMPYAAILSVLTDPFTMILPMKYVFDVAGMGANYSQAVADSNNGKNPSAWANYIGVGYDDPTYLALNQYIIGTGPFYIYDYGPAQDFLILKKNPYYWNSTLWNSIPNGGHDTVIYVMNSDDAARATIYQSGAADMGAVTLDRLLTLNGTTYENTNYQLILHKDPNLLDLTIAYMVWNTLKYPFNDTRIRQALAWAVKYDQIINTVYSGFAIQLYGWIPKTMLGYTEFGITKYSYDLDKARQILEEIGFLQPMSALLPILPYFLIGIPTIYLLSRFAL